MNETVEYYNRNAKDFVASTADADMSECRGRFLAYVPEGGCVLDAGCGSGRDTAAFMKQGYEVDAFDASPEICRLASEAIGKEVECRRFEDLQGSDMYDGIWACASLLHVKAADLPEVIERLYRLLRRGGIIYASFKEGSAERVKEGRYFHDMTADECRRLFESVGFEVKELFTSEDVREGRTGERWVNVIAKKQEKARESK